MEKAFWNDVASKGAILGLMMLVSHIFELAMMLNGDMGRMGIVGAEMIVVFGLYVYLLFRFTKRYSQQFSQEEGFTFGKGFSYVLTLSIFTSVVVGLGGYIFTHLIIGYEQYINCIVNLYTNILSAAQLPSQMIGTYEQMIERIAEQPEPSIFTAITSSMWGYTFLGVFAGLIIAGIVKREPNIFSNDNN